MVWDLEFRVWGLGFWGLEFRVSDLGRGVMVYVEGRLSKQVSDGTCGGSSMLYMFWAIAIKPQALNHEPRTRDQGFKGLKAGFRREV